MNTATQKVIAHAFIGANYGDEAKGAATRIVCRILDIKDVFRFNGANQAGHTGYLNGKPNVFHTFSTACLNEGTYSWCTRDVLINPAYVKDEFDRLKKFLPHNTNPLEVHADSPIITPWDVALNQFLELGRENRHGSVGKGVNEAVTRHESGLTLVVKDLWDNRKMMEFQVAVWDYFVLRLSKEFAKGGLPKYEHLDSLVSRPVALACETEFAKYPKMLADSCSVYKGSPNVQRSPSDNRIQIGFEGAQGLLLDQNNAEHFPHLTRSNTGIKNVVAECERNDWDLGNVYYVTRPYLTRHGAGPILAGEECPDYWTRGEDVTNAPGPYQGHIRYGILDWGKLKSRIEKDMRQAPSGAKASLMISCWDQITRQFEDYPSNPEYVFLLNGEKSHYRLDSYDGLKALHDKIQEVMGDIQILAFYGRMG